MRRSQFIYEFGMELLKEKEMQLKRLIHTSEQTYEYTLDKLNGLSTEFETSGKTIKEVVTLTRGMDFNISQIPDLKFQTSKHKEVLIQRYLTMFIQSFFRIVSLKHRLKYHKLYYGHESLFKEAIYAYNYNMVKEMIMGAKMRLGKEMGTISIFKKKRTFYIDEETTVTRNIDWGESIKNKQTLIDAGITPYDKNTAPDGVKWFIYHNEDYTYWFKWYNNRFNKFLTGSTFVPLAYVTIDKETRHALEGSFKSVKEVLDCGVFGPIEKLQVIKRKFPNHMLMYNSNE